MSRARAMKASGLGWAPQVPAQWDVAKVCLVARLESGHTPSRQHPEYWIPEECTIPWFSLADIWQLRPGIQEYLGETSEKISPRGAANSAARLLPAGTVVLSRTASVGFAGIMPRPMATTQDFANWVPGDRVSSEYLLYALRAMSSEFERVRYGSTHNTIYMPDIRRLAMPVPSRGEQSQIVRFLRAQLPKLDELIAKKDRLVSLLAEKRQALITQLVTKGLDPGVPMKDAGPILGLLPANWSVVPLRHLLAFGPKNGISPPSATDGGVLSFSISAVRDGRVTIAGNEKYVDLEAAQAARFLIAPGDILLMRGSGNLTLVGTCGLVLEHPEGCTYPDTLMRMRVNEAVDSAFLVAALNSPYVRGQVEVAAQTSNGTYKVAGGDVRGLLVAVPPRSIQARIVSELHAASDDPVGETLLRSIERLREYRQALITAAVTGQIDVSDERAVAGHDERVESVA